MLSSHLIQSLNAFLPLDPFLQFFLDPIMKYCCWFSEIPLIQLI